jgi:hypothetical protein
MHPERQAATAIKLEEIIARRQCVAMFAFPSISRVTRCEAVHAEPAIAGHANTTLSGGQQRESGGRQRKRPQKCGSKGQERQKLPVRQLN